MADGMVNIGTPEKPMWVSAELVWGNSIQPAEDKAAGHEASGSNLPAGSRPYTKAPAVIETDHTKRPTS